MARTSSFFSAHIRFTVSKDAVYLESQAFFCNHVTNCEHCAKQQGITRCNRRKATAVLQKPSQLHSVSQRVLRDTHLTALTYKHLSNTYRDASAVALFRRLSSTSAAMRRSHTRVALYVFDRCLYVSQRFAACKAGSKRTLLQRVRAPWRAQHASLRSGP